MRSTRIAKKLAIPRRLRQRRRRLSTRATTPASRPTVVPVAWAELTSTKQRDLLGAWASLLRKMIRRSEVADERQDHEDASGTPSNGVPAAVDDEAGSRAS